MNDAKKCKDLIYSLLEEINTSAPAKNKFKLKNLKVVATCAFMETTKQFEFSDITIYKDGIKKFRITGCIDSVLVEKPFFVEFDETYLNERNIDWNLAFPARTMVFCYD